MRDLWGNPIPKRLGRYHVFHDESQPNKRWLLIGLLFVEEQHLDEVRSVLQEHRRQENYFSEIHFSQLPGSFGGAGGPKARTARAWMQAYETQLCDKAFFSALAVDRQSPAYERNRFPKDFHAFNRFTAMALKAGIAWHLGPKQLDEVDIHFVSDAKDRATRPDQKWVDNFESYIPYRAQLDSLFAQIGGKNYPYVHLDLLFQDSAREDLLQLCDLLLGATQMALVAGSQRAVKVELGRMIVRWCEDLKRPPWEQWLGLHRKVNLWAFPDKDGHPYNNLPLQLKDRTQLSFL